MKPQRSILFSMLLLSSSTASPLFTNEEDIRRPGILQIGAHIATHISFDADSEISPVVSQQGDSFKKTYSLTHQGASYIALHFANMDLDASCKMEISDADDQQKYVMTGRGRHNQGMFWARHINGDSIKIDLFCNDWSSKAVFLIDEYVAGFPNAGIGIQNRNLRGQNSRSENPFPPLEGRDGRELTICGTNDMRNAQCYASGEFSTQYNAAKAVAKIIIHGSGVCTGWLVGENNVLITAEHCIQNAQQAMNAEYIFNYETEGGGDCSRSGVKENSSTEIEYEADGLIAAVLMDDYALISLTGNPVATHGFLELDDRIPARGEKIYIPQHPDGRDKEIAIFDSHLGTNERCEIQTRWQESCYGRRNTGYYDLSYSCDTQGGSSGSPVISTVTNKVVGLHHCGGGCNIGNVAVPMKYIIADISGYIAASPQTSDPTSGPTLDPTSSPTVEYSDIPTVTPTSSPTVEDSSNPSLTSSSIPTVAPTSSPTVEDSNHPTGTPTSSPTLEDSIHPTVTPTSSPTVEDSIHPTVTPTSSPTVEDSIHPTGTPTSSPTVEDSIHPTVTPTSSPTVEDSIHPTVTPTSSPTVEDSIHPTVTPTSTPTVEDSIHPTVTPTSSPTVEDSIHPTVTPTSTPTVEDSIHPTVTPTSTPTVEDSIHPTVTPTSTPTVEDSIHPTVTPTSSPTVEDSSHPTGTPTSSPTVEDSSNPTVTLSSIPTVAPTSSPTVANNDNLGIPFDFFLDNDAKLVFSAADPKTSGPTCGPTVAPTSSPTVEDSDIPAVTPTKTFTFKGNGYCKGVNGQLYDQARAKRINSADECGARCLEVDDTDFRGFAYKTRRQRCTCFYDNNSEVIATCDRSYFKRCYSGRDGTGPVTSTTRGRRSWDCYGYD